MTRDQFYRHAAAYILLAGLLMSLAISHLHDRASLQGELEYAREAYSQSISEMRQIRSRLDDIKQRQFEILRQAADLGYNCTRVR